MIPLSDKHLRRILKEWSTHYNKGRPHSSLGPGIPDAVGIAVNPEAQRHQIPKDQNIVSKPILGGLHHEYRLEKAAA